MTILSPPVVFLGPTMLPAKARTLAEADFRPPAAMGDITRAACENPRAIVLVDGFFEDGPSAWHKEILWAMSEGVPVIGASSLGALRASELDVLGMLGVGAVYDAFASGRLQDDDEVAVLHGPEEAQWIQVSDAMVDIRDSVGAASERGILEECEAHSLLSYCKAQFFKDRSLKKSLQTVLPGSRTSGEIRQIEEWLSTQGMKLKERDCHSLLADIEMLAEIARRKLSDTPDFNPTIYLSRLQPFGYQHAHLR